MTTLFISQEAEQTFSSAHQNLVDVYSSAHSLLQLLQPQLDNPALPLLKLVVDDFQRALNALDDFT